MDFVNVCNCIVDEELLAEAVDKYCKQQNVYCNKVHKISKHNNYATIVISRKHIYVHELLRNYLYCKRKNYVVHHKDFNKMNNSVDNLIYIPKEKHSKIHSVVTFGNPEECNERLKKLNRTCKLNNVTKEMIEELLKQGMSKTQIAEHFGCNRVTINNKLKK